MGSGHCSPMDDNDIVLAATSGDLVQCVCGCGWVFDVIMSQWRGIQTVGVWMDVIRKPMTSY